MADCPAFALQAALLKGARPRRVANQDRVPCLVRFARRAGHGERHRRYYLLHSGDVLVALGDGAFRRLGDRGEDETVEVDQGGELLTKCAHDRPAVQAGGKPAPDGVDQLEPAAVILDRLVAARVAQRKRDLVGDELQESGCRFLVCIRPLAGDAEGAPHGASLFDRDPQG